MGEETARAAAAARALDHTWSWFALHAAQRLNMLNYWLVAMAFLTTAYVAALDGESSSLASVAIAAVGCLASLAFHRLERRTRQLVMIAERPLGELQSELAEATGIASLRMVDAAAAEQRRWSSYGQIIGFVQIGAAIAFLVAAAVAL